MGSHTLISIDAKLDSYYRCTTNGSDKVYAIYQVVYVQNDHPGSKIQQKVVAWGKYGKTLSVRHYHAWEFNIGTKVTELLSEGYKHEVQIPGGMGLLAYLNTHVVQTGSLWHFTPGETIDGLSFTTIASTATGKVLAEPLISTKPAVKPASRVRASSDWSELLDEEADE